MQTRDPGTRSEIAGNRDPRLRCTAYALHRVRDTSFPSKNSVMKSTCASNICTPVCVRQPFACAAASSGVTAGIVMMSATNCSASSLRRIDRQRIAGLHAGGRRVDDEIEAGRVRLVGRRDLVAVAAEARDQRIALGRIEIGERERSRLPSQSASAIAEPAPPAPICSARLPFGSKPLRRSAAMKPPPSVMSPDQRPSASRRITLQTSSTRARSVVVSQWRNATRLVRHRDDDAVERRQLLGEREERPRCRPASPAAGS